MSHSGRVPLAVLTAAAFALGVAAAATVHSTGQGQVTAASAPTPSQARSWEPPPNIAAGYSAEVLRVLDGDTFEARVRIWPGVEITTKVRLRGIDAPELKAHCAEERIKADSARAALSAMLAQGPVGISQVSLDKYGGRVVADASSRRTASIAEALLAGGHVRRYSSGRRAGWCGGRSSGVAR